MELRRMKRNLKSRGVVWHIYHTILAVELGIIVVIEFIELTGGL